MNRSQDTTGAGTSPSWSLTTTAVWCDDVNQRAILIVKGDWTAYCVLRREREARRIDPGGCRGEACRYLQEYRSRLIAEEQSREGGHAADRATRDIVSPG